MMKNVIKLGMTLLAVVALFSCTGGKKYVLEGKIDGTEVTEAYLAIGEVVDTVEVKDGVFVFKGSLEEPTMATLMVEGRNMSLMLEASEMKVEGAIDFMNASIQYDEFLITGSESQVVFEEFVKEIANHKNSREDYLSFCTEFVNTHADSYFAPYVIGSIVSMLEPKEVDEMLQKLSEEVILSSVAFELATQIHAALAMTEGGQAPDFTMNDVDGNPVTLSDVYAKSEYLLIDFWASWCGPCRGENPNVVANYKKYNSKGFDILGVSLDKEKAAWVKAIADDELTWLHVSDLKGWKNEAAAQYAVRSIPANLLVDKNGKIIARNLRAEDLGVKLSELLD